jgi:hypothetical protein
VAPTATSVIVFTLRISPVSVRQARVETEKFDTTFGGNQVFVNLTNVTDAQLSRSLWATRMMD